MAPLVLGSKYIPRTPIPTDGLESSTWSKEETIALVGVLLAILTMFVMVLIASPRLLQKVFGACQRRFLHVIAGQA